MIVKPFALLPMLVFHRNKQARSLLDHISKARQVQCFAVEIQARSLELPFCRRATPRLVYALVFQRPFQHKFIDQHLPLHELVVKLPRTILQRIKRGDGQHPHLRSINHRSPSCWKCRGGACPRPETSRPETSRPETSHPETSRPETSHPE